MNFDTLDQLRKSGYLKDARDLAVDGKNVSGWFPLEVISELEQDREFDQGSLHKLHKDVGEHRIDFRSYPGTFGDGSLQIVVDRETGRFHADIDKFDPYADVVNMLGHTFGEVLPHWLKRVFTRKKNAANNHRTDTPDSPKGDGGTNSGTTS